MTRTPLFITRTALPLALLLCAATLPARAASSASSEASGSVSASFGSSSTSIENSSNSSSKGDKVAAGDYTIVEMAAAADRPGSVRLKLQAVATPGADGEFFLWMPQEAAELSRLGAGQVITARQRPYGLEFAKAATQQAFFLVLNDDWYRELQTRPLAL